MKIRANRRPRQVRGLLSCRCCDDLYDRFYKIDKQVHKELLEEVNGDCSVMRAYEAVNFVDRD